MVKIYRILLVLVFFTAFGCKKDNLFDKFPPEILFFQNANVENADFNSITLPQATTTSYTVKARISDPFELQKIEIFTIANGQETLVATLTEFGNPHEFFVYQPITGLSGSTDVKFIAIGKDGRQTTKIFKIILN